MRVVPRILDDVAIVHRHQCHHFGDVERGSTTDADHAVGLLRAERVTALHRLRRGWIAVHPCKQMHIQSGSEIGDKVLQHR